MNYKRLNRFLFSALLLCSAHSYGQVWGDYDSRTERRNDAGLQGNAGAKSGFYDTPTPVNFPSGANNWWHLLDIRHVNPANNFAMQFAGSFFNQDLYFRKTNDNAVQPWSRVLIENTGKVGIGLTAPEHALHIFTPGAAEATIFLQPGNWNSPGNFGRIMFGDGNHFIKGEYIQGMTFNDTDKFQFLGGNVGIGTADTKGYKLAVAGNAIAESVTVKLQGQWGDYVFKPSYKLRPLSEVKTFIDQNQHLPEIPSAQEIEKSGIDLGEMVKLQTKKIEELTLYLIESNKQLQQQQIISKQQAKALRELRQSVNLLKAQAKK